MVLSVEHHVDLAAITAVRAWSLPLCGMYSMRVPAMY
jgi:hypothetical protein